jgi:methyl-accepting chemotaxis protein
VDTIGQSVSQILGFANEQSTAIADINTAMSQLDLLTQQNAAMVQETTATTTTIDNEVGALCALIAQFITSQAHTHKAQPRAVA